MVQYHLALYYSAKRCINLISGQWI